MDVKLDGFMEREIVAVRVPGEAVGVVSRLVLGVAERVGARGFQEVVRQIDRVRVVHAREGHGGKVFERLVLAHVPAVVCEYDTL